MAEKSNIRYRPVVDPVWVQPLSEAVTYGGQELTELPIRRPSGKDLLFYGSPVISDPTSDKDARLDFAVVYKLASALSNVPEKVLMDQVAVADLVDLGWNIASFFIPGWQDVLPARMKLKDLSSSQAEPPEGSPESIPEPPSSN